MLDLAPIFEKWLGRGVRPRELVTLKGDASSRRYHRLWLDEPDAPPCAIVMELPADAMAADEVTAGDRPRELPFLDVGRQLAVAGLPVPRIWCDAVELGAVVLEDLGDETFAARVAAQPARLEAWYLAAVELMATMHERMWPLPADSIIASRAFDFTLLRWELDHYREWGAEARHDRTLAPAVRAELDRAFDDLAAEIEALPTGFVHRDYQSRNLMVRGDEPRPESLTIIDFQDALVGPRIYDVVALLNDSYVDVPERVQRAVIERYGALRGIDPDALQREFDLVTVQRKLKDGGRFVFIDRVKGNPDFLPYVDRSFARVRRALTRLEGHGALKAALAAADPDRFGDAAA